MRQAVQRDNSLSSTIPSVPGSLPELSLYQPRAGHPDWPRLSREARALATLLRPKLARPRTTLEDLPRRLSSLRSYVSNYRYNRALHRQGREDYRPFVLHWTTVRSCNFSCVYCDDHQGNKYPELSNVGVLDTAGAQRLLRVMRTRASALYLAGGEPTARADLPQLTRFARDLDYFPIIVNTNASLLHRLLDKPAWRNWLADVDNIIVSLDGFDLASLRTLWGYNKPEEVMRNLLLLRELSEEMRFKLMINTVIQPDTLREARDVLDFANDLGIWFMPVPLNVGPTVDPAIRSSAKYADLVDTTLARKRAGYRIPGSLRLNERVLRSEQFTCRTTLEPQVDYDGKLFWPCKATVNVKPLGIDVLAFDDVDAIYEHARTLVEPTRFHGQGSNQCGASCNWTKYYTTDVYAQGLARPWSVAREVAEFAFRR